MWILTRLWSQSGGVFKLNFCSWFLKWKSLLIWGHVCLVNSVPARKLAVHSIKMTFPGSDFPLIFSIYLRCIGTLICCKPAWACCHIIQVEIETQCKYGKQEVCGCFIMWDSWFNQPTNYPALRFKLDHHHYHCTWRNHFMCLWSYYLIMIRVCPHNIYIINRSREILYSVKCFFNLISYTILFAYL